MDTWNLEQLKSHLDNGDRVFLKIFKKGCGVCRLSEPATDRLESKNDHNLLFAKIDCEEHPEILDSSNAESLPSFYVFADGKRKGTYVGFKGLKKLQDFVDGCFS